MVAAPCLHLPWLPVFHAVPQPCVGSPPVVNRHRVLGLDLHVPTLGYVTSGGELLLACCITVSSPPVVTCDPRCSHCFLVSGNIFYERVIVDESGKRVYPDATDVKAHAGILASRMESGTMQPTACPGLSNDIVSVVTGQLFDERDQFHLQVQASCIVPTRNEVAAFAEATAYWRATAPFYGIPFKADLTPEKIQIVLAAFAERLRIAVTVIDIPKMGVMPAVTLIGADPVSIATAINTAAEVEENWEPENKRLPARPKPTHGKFGYNFAWHNKQTEMSVSVIHPGLQDLLQEDSELHSFLEVRLVIAFPGSNLFNLFSHLSLVVYSPAPFAFRMTGRNRRICISSTSPAGYSRSLDRYSGPIPLRQ